MLRVSGEWRAEWANDFLEVDGAHGPVARGRRETATQLSTLITPHSVPVVKDTLRATVRVGFDGRVSKTFRGPKAEERFANEVRVLRHLEARGCPFVPRLLEADPDQLRIVTSNCGSRVEHLDDARRRELFAELEPYGVRHEDADMRNVTYRNSDGRFCLIDFEFATILDQ